jgi:non-specific serine/threonine protein kinase
MLETIREYAHEKLDDSGRSNEFRNRHLEYYVALAEGAEAHIFGAESVRYHKRIDLELDNTRAAMDWAIETGRASMAFRLGAALAYFWYNRSFVAGEWQGQLNRALALPEGSSPTPERANALNAKGFSYWATLIPVGPRRELEEALAIGRELGDNRIAAMSLCNLGLVEITLGDYKQALSLLEQSLMLLREPGRERNLEQIWVLTFLGDVALSEGRPADAAQYYLESSSILRDIRDTNFLAYVVRRQGQLAWYQGRFEEALRLCGESLELNRDLGDERGVIASLSAFAGIATARERTISATRLLGGVEWLTGDKRNTTCTWTGLSLTEIQYSAAG